MCDDKYDTLVVDCGLVLGDMRAELEELGNLMEEDPVSYVQYKAQYDLLQKYHDKLNEVL